MGFEPRAAERLSRIAATTSDPALRGLLGRVVSGTWTGTHSTHEEREMESGSRSAPAAPNFGTLVPDLGREAPIMDIPVARGSWIEVQGAADVATTRRELERLSREAVLDDMVGSRLLAALGRQREVLRLVAEAHRGGVAQLPLGLAERVERALDATPDLLRAERRATTG